MEDKITQLFKFTEEIDKQRIVNELSSMRNSQPPNQPTFMVGQENVKSQLIQQFERSLSHRTFFYTVIVGEVGGGKTHLLNLIKSTFREDLNHYVVEFRTEETSQVQYNFPKMIVASLFKRYYDEFIKVFVDINLKEVYNKYSNNDLAYAIGSYLDVSPNLATAVYHMQVDDKKSFAIRIIGGCENPKDLSKFGISKLTEKDYMDILRLFLKNKSRSGFLFVMLDEFEHTYTYFTPAKRRDFLKGYKAFIDEFSKGSTYPLILITAVTEQSAEKLQDRISKLDTALASRLKPQTIMLEEFKIGDNKVFEELYKEIARRYKIAYGYEVGDTGAIKMRKKIFDKWGSNSAQQKTYRDVITTMLNIMDEMQRNNESFEKTNILINDKINIVEYNNSSYDQIKREVEVIWEHDKKARLTMVKKGLENLLESYILDFQNRKVGLGKGKGTSAICFLDDISVKRFIYIALQDIKGKLKICDEMKEEQLTENESILKTYFLYVSGEDVNEQFKNYPDIKPINIDMERLDLMALSYKHNLDADTKDIILKSLERLAQKLIGGGKNINV